MAHSQEQEVDDRPDDEKETLHDSRAEVGQGNQPAVPFQYREEQQGDAHHAERHEQDGERSDVKPDRMRNNFV